MTGEGYEPPRPIARSRAPDLDGDDATAIVGLDTTGAVRTWNRSASALTGHDAADVIGTDLDAILADDVDSGWVRRAIEQAENEGQFVDEVPFEGAETRRFWATVTVAVARDADGDSSGYLCSIEAVGTEEPTNQSTALSRQWLQALFDKSPDAIAVHDESGRIQAVNEQTVEDLGYSREAFRLMNVADFDVDHDLAELTELWAGMAIGDRVKTSTVHRRKDGTTFPVDVWLTKLGVGDEVQFLALGRDVTDQKKRERVLERQRTSLKRVKQVTERLRPLNRELVRASTPEEIRAVVCEQLAMTDSYEFVWYGEYDPLAERIIPRASAGADDGYLDSIEVTVGDGETAQGPAGRAVRTKSVHASRSFDSDPSFEPWREEALARGFRSGAAIPVVVEGNVRGIVGVYSDRPKAFDEYERGVLEELGERVGHALQAAEQRRLLCADSVEELVFRTADDRSPFVAASEQLDCRLELDAIIPAVASTYVSYLTVDGADPADVVAFFETTDGIEEPRVISSDGPTGTIEYRVCTSPVTKVLEYDATVSSAVIEDGVETVHGEVAPEVPTQPIVAGMRSAYSDLELVAKRTVDRPFRSTERVTAAVDDVLTDRQREVLALAYHAGFFESPRRSTGDDLADALGIAASTFYLHVRRGTKNVLGELAEFDVLE